MTARVPARLAAQVKARAVGRCEYCHAPQVLIGQAFHLDHITPRSAGGQTTAENLCLACSRCNIAKGDRTEATDPRTGKRLLLYNPRTDIWEEHFRWSRDWKQLIGRTPFGRATVRALEMNARLLQKARPFWRVAGLIP
ncbi:MAG TPA: HNH endonuclease [Candidatus Binatia bacterium]|nr:HNH endonuclease [Candidatus Binatia bacterium]